MTSMMMRMTMIIMTMDIDANDVIEWIDYTVFRTTLETGDVAIVEKVVQFKRKLRHWR